ncbi:probable protein phosphatase 2C 33 [Impatiens glandulifera]|uniref:probable protein phosphatase 2C 33 n=1 Tax=Impatiens glandulifera TaxID=253017 RepID=UPI001FB0BEA7|nr:probable protein phosphatase 2C 33 [Impatiens glandulifera]XP_047327667.1 probable protein phosphatase 2C 33 [Impatiens glandulifera]
MGSCLSFESRNPLPNSPLGVRKRKNSKKRNSGSRSSSFDSKREDLLHRIPGRMFLNGSSEMASIFTQQGKKGTNQDAMIVWENFGSRSDTVFCGVFDGHGPYGHLVAKRVRDCLPLKLSSHWEGNSKSEINVNSESTSLLAAVDEDEEEEEGRASNDERDKNLDIFQDLKELFLKAFKVMDRELKFHTNFDSFCSGTTAVTLIKQGQHLVIGNVGDSRAVLGTRDKNNSITAVQLTVDLKPNLPKEAERIRKCRGRVFALHDEPEVSRVWLPNNDSPGLAMARAFGDFCLKDFGLISIPEITYRCLNDKDEFVVLATDGVWDVLSNEEVVNVVSSAPSRALAARSLVEKAVRAWRYKYPTSKVDDCAVVCLFLDVNLNNVSTANSKKKVASMTKNEDHSFPAGLDSSGTTRKGSEERKEESEDEDEDDGEEEMEFEESGMEWSALEGVARVNTLLTLPRFDPGKDQRKDAAP